jgi:LacI family transcriptional regulator
MASGSNRTPAAPRTTIRDIARQAGVSTATVSRVLNGHPHVAQRTRDAVMRAVREHEFSTNRSARGLSAGRSGLIGMTIPVIGDYYFDALLSGVAEALYDEDMRVVLCPTQHEHDREVTLVERLLHGTTDGAILVLPEESSAELKAVERRGFPLVILDPLKHIADIPSVTAAHASGAKQAVDYLLELGHRRIAAITGPRVLLATEERLHAYLGALATAAGGPVDPNLVAVSNFSLAGGFEAAGKLLDLDDPPTAIFAFNDALAIGAMRAARQRGIRVPEDLSIIGFDDAGVSENAIPMLTTVRQPLAEMGRMAVSLLTRLLDNQRVEAMRVELATSLVVRETTGPPPESRGDRSATARMRVAAT